MKTNFMPRVTIFEVPLTRGISLASYGGGGGSYLPLSWRPNAILKPQRDLKYGVVSVRSISHN